MPSVQFVAQVNMFPPIPLLPAWSWDYVDDNGLEMKFTIRSNGPKLHIACDLNRYELNDFVQVFHYAH
jgi:hypothetical protein